MDYGLSGAILVPTWLEMLICERTTGTGLEIALKPECASAVGEGSRRS
jgi:hypothetical protein